MRRGTTPTITLTVDADLTGWTVYATFKSGGKQLTFENDRMEMTYTPGSQGATGKTAIEITLTQQETLSLGVGNAEVQVRAIHDGTAIATDIQAVDVGRIIKEGVIDE